MCVFALRFTNTLLQENLKFVSRVKFRINSTNPSRCEKLTETCCVFCEAGAEFLVSVLCACLQNVRSTCYSTLGYLVTDPLQYISGHTVPILAVLNCNKTTNLEGENISHLHNFVI